VAFVTFYQGQKKAFETPPIQVSNASEPRLKTMPLRFTVPLAGVQPGVYDCQVTILDPEGQRAAFWQAPIEVAP